MDVSYQHFSGDTDDSEDAPIEHVVIHVPPTSKVTRWSHIEDLDLFFTRLYAYHQKHGFFCILLQGFLELLKVVFMVVFCVFLLYFLDYQVLFFKKLPKNYNITNPLSKVTVGDAVCSFDECFGHISGLTWMCITIVLIYWFFRLVKLTYNLYHFWDIKGFFNIALQIADDQLTNITWQEVEKKICEVQVEHKMCIRKNELTELDIYHRILRSKNYMVAMINKSVLPIHHNIPFIGNVAYMSQGLKYNVELLLFSGTWGFFENWHLKEDYKKASKRQELAAKLQRNIAWFAIGNLFLGVFIFFWQLVYFFFNNAELLKREPGVLALRCWSLYARLYLRHFNELDHELDARLRRAYEPASKYMNTFNSPVMMISSEFLIFTTGSILCVVSALIIWDEDVSKVEHAFTIVAVLTGIIAMFRGFIPKENECCCPETVMVQMLAEVHYLPDTWRGQAHTSVVRDQFAQFFQYKATYLFFELISPVVTPIIFYFKLRPRSLEIIDFYRNFTVSVLGVGDVCSFSLMDMRRHGNPAWQAPGRLKCPENNKQTQAENGKTELSLIHFAKMNPTWHPPEDAEQFIHEVQERVRVDEEEVNIDAKEEEKVNIDAKEEREVDTHSEALESVLDDINEVLPQNSVCREVYTSSSQRGQLRAFHVKKQKTPSSSYYYNPTFSNSVSSSRHKKDKNKSLTIVNSTPALDMSASTLYLHSLHHNRMSMKNTDTSSELQSVSNEGECSINSSSSSHSSRIFGRHSDRVSEGTPLLKNVKPA